MDFSVVTLLSLTCMVDAFDYKHRCLLYDKKCVDNCPRQMYPYHTRCDGQTKSQRTCSNPSTYVIGYTCGWSRCDCNNDLLLNEDIGLCVALEDCPAPMSRKLKNRKRKKRPVFRLPKTFDPRQFEDPLDKIMRDTV